MRWAARLMRSASATEVPPNFITTVSVPAGGMVGNDSFPPVRPELARRRLAIALLAALALGAGVAGAVVGGAQDDDGQSASSVPTPGRATPEESLSFLARIVPPPAERRRAAGAEFPPRIARVARRLSTERKVAQLFVLGFRGTDSTAEIFGRLRRLDLGGIVI